MSKPTLNTTTAPPSVEPEKAPEAVCCGHCADGTERRVSLWWGPEAVRTSLAGLLFFTGLILQGSTSDPALLRAAWWTLPLSGIPLMMAAAVGGWNFFPAGVRSALRLKLDMNVLMSIAIVGAAAIPEFVEAAAIAFLFSVAEHLERFAVQRAHHSLESLVKLTPAVARVRREGAVMEASAESVQPGETVVVRAGERLPVDGTVVDGTGTADQSPVTGESVPAEKAPGAEVYSGSVLLSGYLEVRADRPFGDSTLQRVVRLIRQAQAQRAPIERFVDRFARWYTPAVVMLAVGVATVPPLAAGASFQVWFLRALTLLVIACPCALVISTPVSVVSALTGGARGGILIKGGTHLEALGGVRCVAFDKTGTLTEGEHRLQGIEVADGTDPREALRIAAALEVRSSHPLARAITAGWHLRSDGAALPEVGRFQEQSGVGVEGFVEGRTWCLGRLDSFPAPAEGGWKIPGGPFPPGVTAVLLGEPGKAPSATLLLADSLRQEAPATVRALRRAGVERIVMLTGDGTGPSRAAAEAAGIEEVYAELLPEGKVEAVQMLRSRGGRVAMVGDGINDGPALAAADVGIAMGAGGSQTAMEAADVALIADDLTRLPAALRLGRRAGRVIRQNIAFSLFLKIALAIGVIPGAVTLIVAVLVGDMGASLVVTANALRLARAAR